VYFVIIRDSGTDEYVPVSGIESENGLPDSGTETETTTSPSPTPTTYESGNNTDEGSSSSPSGLGLNLSSVSLDSLFDTGYLKMVNRTLPVMRIQEEKFLAAHPTVAVSTIEILLHETALTAVSRLFQRGRSAGFDSFFVTSGVRTQEHQQSLWDNPANNRAYLMEPGHSEHHLGLAADILATGISMSQMSGTPEAAFLAANAWHYGLILRYPYGKEHITQVPYEPWHLRYVGRVHAWYMYHNDLVLEEYLPLLEERREFSVTLEGRTYYIMYQHPVSGFIQVPDLDFRLSASNQGGYIITAWR